MKIDKDGYILCYGYKFHPDALKQLGTFSEIFTEKEMLEISKMVLYCQAELGEKFHEMIPPETLRLLFELTHFVQMISGKVEFPCHE